MEHIVHGCSDCPFANWDHEVCKHPHKDRRIDLDTRSKLLPTACPLLKKEITIKLIENANSNN